MPTSWVHLPPAGGRLLCAVLVAAGCGTSLIPDRGATPPGQDAGSPAADGSSPAGPDGGVLPSADGGPPAGPDGGASVNADGGAPVGADGGAPVGADGGGPVGADGGGPAGADGGAPAPDAGAVDCVTQLWANLEACGWPGPTNTGYPAGTVLTETAGRTITVDNTVIDGEKINGGLTIDAQNVTVRNCWITRYVGKGEAVNGTGVIQIVPGASATIERNLIDGQLGVHACIWDEGTSLVARGNHCMNVNDGIFIWDTSNFTIEDNYLHEFTTETANGHVDGFQTEGASHGVIRHNVFDVTQDQNACVAIWNSRASSDDILVENNLMAGSGFAVYAEDYSPSEEAPAGGFSVTNVRFIDNHFSTVHYDCVGNWGVWYPRGSPTDAWVRTGNVVVETGESVDSTNPHVGGQLCN